MPQLSPLNWVFLFILFWSSVILVSILIWWSKKTIFSPDVASKSTLEENKWNW
uniref:ATP synthase complex subunit 8 n=1 Tax=Potamopyrgus antipodarum TaxID=145637 RepID=A0A2P1JGY4_POTAT|nr:ATP synthase F0 subunit 8 [Potamopyrgus antipodarum]